jgi:hypothetical protein
MSKTQKSTMRRNEGLALEIARPAEADGADVLAVREGAFAPVTAGDDSQQLAMAVEASGWAVAAFGLPAGAIVPAGLLRVLPACVEALLKTAKELALSPEQQERAMLDFLGEAERRLPQIVIVLFVLSQLPGIEERAFRHFRHQRDLRWHDAENLSHDTVLKILSALTGAWPHGNVGAWLSAIREHVHLDHRRRCDRHARGMARLERALDGMRM